MDEACFVEALIKIKASLLYFLIFCFSLSLLFAQNQENIATPEIIVGGEKYTIVFQNITVAEYCLFLNAVAATDDVYYLYDQKMGLDPLSACIVKNELKEGYSYSFIEGTENNLAPYLNWFRAARFCNWLKNRVVETHLDSTVTDYDVYDLKKKMPEPPKIVEFLYKNNGCLLSGDEEAAMNHEIPDSFFDSDPFIAANKFTIPIDLIISAKHAYKIKNTKEFTPNPCFEDLETVGKDLIETLLIASIAAFVAGASILLVGALSGYPVAAFIGTALAARSASDKIITKATTKNGIQPLYWELLAAGGSILVGMLLGLIMTAGILTPAALVLALPTIEVGIATAGETIAQEVVATEETYIFGLFKKATGEALKDFQQNPLRTLFASLWGSAVGAHLSTHLDSGVAKALDNTKAL